MFLLCRRLILPLTSDMNPPGVPLRAGGYAGFGKVTAVVPARLGEAVRVIVVSALPSIARRLQPSMPPRRGLHSRGAPLGRCSPGRAGRPGRPAFEDDCQGRPAHRQSVIITSVALHPTTICLSSGGGLLRRNEAGATTRSAPEIRNIGAAMTGSHSRPRPRGCSHDQKNPTFAGIHPRGSGGQPAKPAPPQRGF